MKNISNQASGRTTTNLDLMRQMMNSYAPELEEEKDTEILRYSTQTDDADNLDEDTTLTQKHMDDAREQLIACKWNIMRMKQLKQRNAILAWVHMTNLRRMKERLKERRKERMGEWMIEPSMGPHNSRN